MSLGGFLPIIAALSLVGSAVAFVFYFWIRPQRQLAWGDLQSQDRLPVLRNIGVVLAILALLTFGAMFVFGGPSAPQDTGTSPVVGVFQAAPAPTAQGCVPPASKRCQQQAAGLQASKKDFDFGPAPSLGGLFAPSTPEYRPENVPVFGFLLGAVDAIKWTLINVFIIVFLLALVVAMFRSLIGRVTLGVALWELIEVVLKEGVTIFDRLKPAPKDEGPTQQPPKGQPTAQARPQGGGPTQQPPPAGGPQGQGTRQP